MLILIRNRKLGVGHCWIILLSPRFQNEIFHITIRRLSSQITSHALFKKFLQILTLVVIVTFFLDQICSSLLFFSVQFTNFFFLNFELRQLLLTYVQSSKALHNKLHSKVNKDKPEKFMVHCEINQRNFAKRSRG